MDRLHTVLEFTCGSEREFVTTLTMVNVSANDCADCIGEDVEITVYVVRENVRKSP